MLLDYFTQNCFIVYPGRSIPKHATASITESRNHLNIVCFGHHAYHL